MHRSAAMRHLTLRISPAGSRFGDAIMLVLFLACYLLVAPHVHQRIHSDAGKQVHQCALTLLASGHCAHAAAPIVGVTPAYDCLNTVASRPVVVVSSVFLAACIFEHAPPVLS